MSDKKIFQALFTDAFGLIVVRVGGMVCSMALIVIVARFISPEELGYYSMGASTALLAGLACTVNFGASAVRFLGKYRSDKDWNSALAYVKAGRKIVGMGAVLFTLFGFVLLWMPSNAVFNAFHPSIAIAFFAAPFQALLRIESANVHALGSVVRFAVPGMLIRPVLLLVAVLASAALNVQMDATYVMGLFLGSQILIAAVQYFVFQPSLSIIKTPSADVAVLPTVNKSERSRDWVKVSMQLLVPVLFLELSVDTIVVIASIVLSAEDVAVLSVVLRLQAIMLFGVTSINMAVDPSIVKAFNDGDKSGVRKLLGMSGHLKLWPSLVLMLGLYLYGDLVLGIFGEHYAAYSDILLILCLSPLVLACYGPTVLFMTVLGLQQRGSNLFLLSMGLLAVLILVLGSVFGLPGVAWSVIIVWIVWNHTLNRWVKDRSDIDTSLLAGTAFLQKMLSRNSST